VQQAVEDVGSEQPELEVLGAAPDRRRYLLRIGRREDEDDVARWFLERLQQRVRGGVREHVDLVDDVDLPSARRPEGGMGDQVPDGVDAVVRRGVELVDVERRAASDLHAGRTDAARLAVLGIRAVQCPGEDAGGRRLPGAARPAEQVGMGDVAVADRALEGQDDVGLAPQLGEPAGSEPPVEGDEGFVATVGVGHPAETTGVTRPARLCPRALDPPAFGAVARLATAHGLTR
jgi:hypothetical protein